MLLKEPKIEFIDDGPGKPVGINRFIGRRPDPRLRQLRRRPADAPVDGGRHGAALLGIVHHTDAEREWAYDRTSHIGKLDKALDEAVAKGWTVVDMKKDWKRIYPFDK